MDNTSVNLEAEDRGSGQMTPRQHQVGSLAAQVLGMPVSLYTVSQMPWTRELLWTRVMMFLRRCSASSYCPMPACLGAEYWVGLGKLGQSKAGQAPVPAPPHLT